ncbi:hypothetical protein ACB094_09G174500 [Castanea mollissima]
MNKESSITLGRRSIEKSRRVWNPNLRESQFSKSQNPNKIPKHLTTAFTVATAKPPSLPLSFPTKLTSTDTASPAFSALISCAGTSGSTTDRNDNSAAAAVESSVSELEAAVSMAAAK